MELKASLHLHSGEDKEDAVMIRYSLYELIDRAAALGFKVLASTGHGAGICGQDHVSYAKGKGILLIPGAELEVCGKRHLLILNGGSDADDISDLKQLEAFRLKHPEAFIIAPHPNHGARSSLGLKLLKRYASSIDAAEHSWFHSKSYDPNRQAGKICAELKMPFIATADAHVLDYLDLDYALIEAKELTAQAVFAAIKAGRFRNHATPKPLYRLVGFVLLMASRYYLSYLKRR